MTRAPGRPRAADGLTALERAEADCDAALKGKRCSLCGARAVTGKTAHGEVSFARLRQGDHPADRARILAAITDWRCAEHAPRGRDRAQDGLTSIERGKALVAARLRGRRCAEPGCTAPATTAFTPPGLPTLGQLAQGIRLAEADAALAAAIPYCTTHLTSRTARGLGPGSGDLDADVAALGGPSVMVRALASAPTLGQLRGRAGTDLATFERGYARLGIYPGRVLAHRFGLTDAEPPAPGRRLNAAERIRRRGGADRMLEALADAVSSSDLARRLGCAKGGSAQEAVIDGYTDLGVDVAAYLSQRLREAPGLSDAPGPPA